MYTIQSNNSSSSSLHIRINKYANPSYPTTDHHTYNSSQLHFNNNKINNHTCACKWHQNKEQITWITTQTKAKNDSISMELNNDDEEEQKKPNIKAEAKKKGTIAGAVALVIGTSIGSGILALPQKASPAGIVPSSIAIIICWAFLLLEALLLIEINVSLRKKKRKVVNGDELDVISLTTMAQETLGDWGANLATLAYIFLGYTSMIAYSSKSGELLFHLINLPESLSGCLFTVVFTVLISVGGTRATDQVNQWLTVNMIGLLIAIEVLAVLLGGWSGFEGIGDWGKIPAAVPVIIFSLVYHDLVPVLCAYLGGDLSRLRVSVVLGSLVPLLSLLIWDAIALGLSSQTDQLIDPVELLMSVKWSGVSYMVEAFSLLAVGTSLIGTLLGFSEFFKEQIKNFSSRKFAIQLSENQDQLKNLWKRNTITITAMTLVIAPTLLVSTTVPDVFYAATDIAGGYCMTILYGILPPAMAWEMYGRERKNSKEKELWKAKSALVGVGLFACGIVIEQIFQDFLALHL